jgi:methylmalonyl-CoA/ethylmalonyl-CoA epimerase
VDLPSVSSTAPSRRSAGERVITRIHHVGLVVNDLDLALGFWRDTLDLPVLQSAELPDQGVRAALLACGTSEVEVLVPTTPDTGIARFLANRGECLHHVCFESDDIAREVRRLIGTGVDMIDEKPREGLAGTVAFVHPRACGNLLVELATPSVHTPLPETPVTLAAVHGKVEDVGAAAQQFQDLFGMTRGVAADDESVVQLSLAGLTLLLAPLNGGFPKPAFSALRLRTGNLPALARRLEVRGIACRENPVGLEVPSGPARGAPLIIESDR